MRAFLFLTLILGAFALSTPTAQSDSHAMKMEAFLSGTSTVWQNQSGSVATLDFTASRSQPGTWTVSGHYVNNAAGTGCKGTPYPLSGVYYVSSVGVISFSVAWSNASANCNSATGWTGYLTSSDSDLQFVTNWNLAYESAAGGAITSGTDTFTMQANATVESLVSE